MKVILRNNWFDPAGQRRKGGEPIEVPEKFFDQVPWTARVKVDDEYVPIVDAEGNRIDAALVAPDEEPKPKRRRRAKKAEEPEVEPGDETEAGAGAAAEGVNL